jgi:hypothetical protein
MGRELLDQQTASRAAGLMTYRRQKTLSADSDKIDTKPILEFQRRKKRAFAERLDQHSTIVINRQLVPIRNNVKR